jgi:glycerol-3-phosphate dehydrogenase (NAD(P)+)
MSAPDNKEEILVLGAGNWGTSLAWMLGGKGYNVRLWDHNFERALDTELKRVNRAYLPAVELPDTVGVGCDLATLALDVDLMIVAMPTTAVRHVVRKNKPRFATNAPIISATKGFEPETGARMSEVLVSELGPEVSQRLAVLSGPNLAPEIVAGCPTATVLASTSEELVARLQRLVSTDTFRCYASSDLIGVEIGGALKNVIAIACGIADELGLGLNAKGALLTRGLAEITRLGVAQGANPLTFQGLSGMGDLVATCSSPVSRNHTVGRMLARGATLAEARSQMKMVAEGVNTTRAALRLAVRHGVSMPITTEVQAILFEGKSPRQAIRDLMRRDLRREDE